MTAPGANEEGERTGRMALLRLVARLSGALALAIGVVALAGWWFHLGSLRAPLPAFAPISQSSAWTSVLSGAALLLLVPEDASRHARLVARTLAGAGLFLEAAGVAGRFLAGAAQPSVRAAASFVCIDVALLSFDRVTARGRRPAEVCAFAALGIATVAVLGFTFGAPALRGAYGTGPSTGMALSSAVVAFALGVGVLAARPRAGLMAVATSDEVGGIVARRMLLVLFTFPPIVALVALGIHMGWFAMAEAAGLLVFLGLLATVVVTLTSACRLNLESRAKHAAEASQARLASVVASSDDAIVAMTPDGVVTDWNDAATRMYGHDAQEMIGQSIRRIVPEDRLAEVAELLARARRGERIKTYETARITKDGTRIPVSITASAVSGSSGRISGVSIISRDIRERLAAADALATSEANLRALVAQAADGIFVADRDGRTLDVNEAGCRMSGHPRDELVGRPISDVLTDEDVATLTRDRAVLLGGGTVVGERRMRRKDGTSIPIEVSAKILRDGRWQAFVRDITERKQMEHALREARADLERAQEVARVGSWRLDVRNDVLRWSDEAYRIFGIAPGTSLTYETFLGSVHPDDRAYVDRCWAGALRGEPYDIEHRIVARGELKWVREKAELDFGEAGELLGGIGIVQDITEAKAARAQLDRLLDASVAMSDALASLPEVGMRAAFGTIAVEAQALTQAEYAALGLGDDPRRPFDPWIVVGPTDEHPTTRRELHSLLGAPIPYKGRTSGTLFVANKRGAEAFSEDDERVVAMLAGRAGSAIETARLYESEALQRLWLETLLEQMPEAVVITDERGRVLHRSRSAEALERDALRLDPWGNPLTYDLRRPSGAPLPRDELPSYRAIARGEQVAGVELAIVSPEGELVPILASATPFRTKGGQTGAITVFRDIRAMKELERLREEWTSLVAHDLRQPVSGISYGAEALASLSASRASEKETRIIDGIKRASGRLERMIADLLDVSRIDARRLSLTRRMVDLREVVERVVASMTAVTDAFDVHVVAPGEQPAFVDPDRIEQVLVNLLSNAVKYGDPGTEILVEVSSHEERVEVSVINHGPGISAEDLPRLFNRFARTRDARESGVPGIGLGLYIARALVEAHGGTMSVESSPGDTTRFRFTVPRIATGSALDRVHEGVDRLVDGDHRDGTSGDPEGGARRDERRR